MPTSKTSSNFRIEVVGEDDLPELVALIVPTFAIYPVEVTLGNINTPEAIEAATERHRRAWREHMDESGIPGAIKCVHKDPESGEEKMVACANWFIYQEPRSREHWEKQSYLATASWLPEEGGQRKKAQESLRPMVEGRKKWTAGRGHAIFTYMATDPRWRRQGAATACVQWGIDRCRELNIPAYLEASREGLPVYERLGFVEIDHIESEGESFPTMMWWPPGMKDEDKKPLTL